MLKFYYSLLAIFLFLPLASISQDDSSTIVKWQFTAGKRTGDVLNITAKAAIADGWRLFSTSMKDDEPNSRVSLDSAGGSSASIIAIKESDNVRTAREPLFDNAPISYYEKNATFEISVQAGKQSGDLSGIVSFMAMKGDEVAGPEEVPFRFSWNAAGEVVAAKGGIQESATATAMLKRPAIDLNNPKQMCGGTGVDENRSGGLLSLFILGFLGGLIALFTPCVFPMIPLTVSFFTKKAQNRKAGIKNALLYGFFIFIIYVLLSLPFHLLDSISPEILNTISTNIWLNIIFFVIFVAFALSFFGLFEITLPSSLSNSVDAKAGIGGMAGIFFMALTLALVSFSCTGPILGSLLAGSLTTNGGAMQLTVGMGGFGLALALPFGLFALFPGWLRSLPRSGGWLASVKIVLGFLELALAVKFLSNADMVAHWGILPREVFIGIWILIGLLLVLYLLTVIRFKHEGPVSLNKTRVAFAAVFLAAVIYLAPGFTKTKYANRALISGFPPPLTYSIYGKEAFRGVEANVVNDYQKALDIARQQNKPILIDFTGWACVNCRKMEENVWTLPEVKASIEKNFILVSLYVDDRKLLPPSEQFLFTTADGSRKEIKTIGDKFATFQSENFRNVSQPLYAVISPDEELLSLPVGYTPDAQKYLEWLDCSRR